MPPDAVRCLARISFAKVKYGLDSDIVRMGLSDNPGVRGVKLTDLAFCLGKGTRFLPLPLVFESCTTVPISDRIHSSEQ